MPYIYHEDRERLDAGGVPQSAGELNYCFCRLANAFLEKEGVSYKSLNDVMGAFSGAGQEFYRRVVAPYEDDKVIQNGDLEWPR